MTEIISPDKALVVKLKNAGSADMNVNGSVTPVSFSYTPDNQALIHEVHLAITDTNILPGTFGGLTALTNGLLLQLLDSDGVSVLYDFLDGSPVKANYQFDVVGNVYYALQGNPNSMSVKMDLTDNPIYMKNGQSIRATVRDNLTGLDAFSIGVIGRKYP